MNPIATLHMANGKKIVIELLPESAPNTVNSFIFAAKGGYLDHHAIERIVPGNWIDMSYTAFGKKECQYLIPNEFELNPDVIPLDSHPGCVCMGGYGDAGLASCEFFFPLRDCPEHKGIYPVFGKVLEVCYLYQMKINYLMTYYIILQIILYLMLLTMKLV